MNPFTRIYGRQQGFTLVELLVVIGIIGLLASILVPVLAGMKQKGKITQARHDISSLVQAIQEYRTHYSRAPVSANAETSSAGNVQLGPADFTFGTVNSTRTGTLTDRNNQPLVLIQNTIEYDIPGLLPYVYQANNSEVISILTDTEFLRVANQQPTANRGHTRNPQQKVFLRAPQASGTVSHGVGDDLVFRDPWSNPYIITLSIAGKDECSDAFYRMAHVSERFAPDDDSSSGFNGLVRSVPAGNPPFSCHPSAHGGGRSIFKAPGAAAVWSFGPDGKANFNWDNSPDHKANTGDNADNILSWKL
jgi:prepilin-type N-terminal cleavage/methylation domain-containing protein